MQAVGDGIGGVGAGGVDGGVDGGVRLPVHAVAPHGYVGASTGHVAGSVPVVGGQVLQVPVWVAAASIAQGVAPNASDGESTYMWAPCTCSLVVYWTCTAVTVCYTVCQSMTYLICVACEAGFKTMILSCRSSSTWFVATYCWRVN